MKDKKLNPELKAFQELISMKYQVYNGLFLTLPFDDLENTGAQLPIFFSKAKTGLENGKSPKQIVSDFFGEITKDNNDQRTSLCDEKLLKTLLKLIQFVERQVVLFDALEDAAFSDVHQMSGSGTLQNLLDKVKASRKELDLEKVLESYKIRVVLTAHPTQFYTNSVLGIISDLCSSIQKNDLLEIRNLLLQLGKTPFMNRQKPSPLDEARSLIWYLENIFYITLPRIQGLLNSSAQNTDELDRKVVNVNPLELGFWPGGDRDGNPFVTAKITEQVAKLLKNSLVTLYINDIKQLKRRLTFKGVSERLDGIHRKLEASSLKEVCNSNQPNEIIYSTAQELLTELLELKLALVTEHQGLFVEDLNSLIDKVKSFGFHFASLDLRQDSRIHGEVLEELLQTKANKALLQRILSGSLKPVLNDSSKMSNITRETLDSFKVARKIQRSNGVSGLHRYVISNTQKSENVLEVLTLAVLSAWPLNELELDIVPLFESIEDLQKAESIMQELYTDSTYAEHLARRGHTQVIMLGFSDGTKDGGYLTANWSILQAKRRLTKLSRKFKVKVVFFDGRGGPPARGGGNTHKFYRSLGNDVEHDQIQLTIQGQTISSSFGTPEAAKYNLEQLFTAGLEQKLFEENAVENEHQDQELNDLMEKLSASSYQAYLQLRNHPLFLPYLSEVTPLRYYDQLNIASRPLKRKTGQELRFEDLRAIPFVGAWTQMKQNIAGFYGLGSALNEQIQAGNLNRLQNLYTNCLFFRTLLENAMQSLCKSYFPLTAYLGQDVKFGEFWQMLKDEAALTEQTLKQVSGQHHLMDSSALSRESIRLREKIVLPLLTIQHFALELLREIKLSHDTNYQQSERLEKLIIKSLAANVNASRNSV